MLKFPTGQNVSSNCTDTLWYWIQTKFPYSFFLPYPNIRTYTFLCSGKEFKQTARKRIINIFGRNAYL